MKVIIRVSPGIFAVACWIEAVGCAPQISVAASSNSTSGEGGSHASSVGAGGTASGGPDDGGASDGSAPLLGVKYTVAADYSDVAWDSARNHVFLSGVNDGLVRVFDLKSSTSTSVTVGHRAEHLHFDSKLDLVFVSIAIKRDAGGRSEDRGRACAQ